MSPVSSNAASARYWAVIAAAGVGARMRARTPKQYLPLAGRCVIEHSLKLFCHHPSISAVVVVVARDDPHWAALRINSDAPLYRVAGGAERCHSVLNGLDFLADYAAADDWILVHDAARPCARDEDINRLMVALRDHPDGGLLAVPARDTMKRANADGTVRETVPRVALWHALTPQMFRFAALRAALRKTLDDGVLVTDEAGAMEYAGVAAVLVEGHADNIKITQPDDLPLAEFYLRQQESSQT